MAVTMPMGILQSSSTQNDWVVSFWMICFVYFGMLFKDRQNWYYASGMAASIGLGIMTKGTAYLFIFPFLIWIVFHCFKNLRWRTSKYILLIGAIVICICFGELL